MSLSEFLEARISEDEALARAASGFTVEGERGAWTAVAGGDEWEVGDGDCEVEVLVALRQHLPRPPKPLDGYWGAITIWKDIEDGEDRAYVTRLAAHISRQDPARILAECAAKRAILKGFEPFGEIDDINAPEILGILAAVYANHPDYLPEWKL